MNINDLINKKKKNELLTKQEIDFFVDGVVNKTFLNEQISAFLMAIYFNGLTTPETVELTKAMARSGYMVNLDEVGEPCVDKHSSGGVCDSTTLILVPILASLGVKIAKMSGGGLGFTGGTVDKLKVFKGYKTELSMQEFISGVKKVGCSVIAQSGEMAVADKYLYKLRDKTSIVDSLPLIASSIMSKKLACGAKILLLDVKYGDGAFMKTKEDAEELAKLMCDIGNHSGVKTNAIITSMEQPLCHGIGNMLEIIDVLKILKGEENILSYVAKKLACQLLIMRGFAKDEKIAMEMVNDSISSGKAINKLNEMVTNQGGENIFDMKFEYAPNKVDVIATKDGYLTKVLTEKLGYKVASLGEELNNGIYLNFKLNDKVKKGDKLCTIYYNHKLDDDFIQEVQNCFVITDEQIVLQDLIYKIV